MISRILLFCFLLFVALDGLTQIEIIQADTTYDKNIFTLVEKMPYYPGGDAERMKYLSENIRYPVEARKKGIQGRVYVTFVVEKDGSINDVRILRGIGGGCDEETVRLISSMPKWSPGVQRSKPVRVQFNTVVIFKLNGNFQKPPKPDKSFAKGVQLMDDGKYQKAIERFTKSINQNSGLTNEALMNRAICKLNLKEYQAADQDLKLVMAKKNDNYNGLVADIYFSLGNAVFDEEDYNSAILYFTNAIKMDPEVSSVYFNRGLAKSKLGLKSEACQDWSISLQNGFEKASEFIELNCN